MKKKIKLWFTLLASFVVLVNLAVSLYFNYQNSIKETKNHLKTMASLIKVELANHDYQKLNDLANKEGFRISIILSDGKVIYDTHAQKLDNHLQRIEVNQALKKGSYAISRYSQTLLSNQFYYSEFYQGYILRVSVSTSSIYGLF